MREFAAAFYDRSSLKLSLWFDEQDRQGYNCFEVWKSESGEGGPYFPLTGPAWLPAVIYGTKIPGVLAGKSLDLVVNSADVSVTFQGPDPISLSSVALQIEAAAPGLLHAVVQSDAITLALQSASVGAQARIEVVGGDAAPILGFNTYSPLNRAYGVNCRPRFSTDVGLYFFEDTWWCEGCAYKIRRYDSTSDTFSEMSNPISGRATRAVTDDRLVRAWMRLVDFQGRPVSGRSVLFATRGTKSPLIQGDLLVDASDLTLKTDDEGYCSLLVLRGIALTVGIGATAIVRDIITPVDPTIDSFNMLDSTYGTDDAFSVQVPRIDLAQRRECE